MNSVALGIIRSLSEKIATELVFARSEADTGLLPINSLVNDLEQVLADHSGLELLSPSLRQARGCIDEILEKTGAFSTANLEWLGQWMTWWRSALASLERESLPAPFNEAGETRPLLSEATNAGEDAPVTLTLDQDAEVLREFIHEAQAHLQEIEQDVLILEERPDSLETLNSIFRAFHTVKGGSGFLNLTPIQTLAHELESLLDLARQRKLHVTPDVVTLILEGGDALSGFMSEIGQHLAGQEAPSSITVCTGPLLRRIRRLLPAQGAQSPASVLCEEPLPQMNLEDPKAAPPLIGEASTSRAGLREPTICPGTASTASTPPPLAGSSTVKVDTNKLDSLVDLVGEMVIAQSLVVQNRDVNILANERLVRDLAQLRRITKELQRIAMSLRMVPVRMTFQKMHRLIRDVSAKVGKRVQLVTEGEETELDRTIVEEISDPLAHMVRNSIDHGIETPTLRLQRGKLEEGCISLKAFHQGGNIVIEVSDDGNGLDGARILAKAKEKGLAQGDEQLSLDQIFNFILAPGFSTADKVTELSGRGVGMDVVRRNIEKLRGKIEIQSKPGQGTTFRVYLPLTLAIIDGLVVSVGESCYIVPTLMVRESFRPSENMINTVQGRGEMVNVRGRLRPLLRLYEHLGIRPASTRPSESIVLVLEAGSEARCVLVDRLLGKQEVVIKSLGETFRDNRYLAGAAILGDGRVGLILDPQALVQLDAHAVEAAA